MRVTSRRRAPQRLILDRTQGRSTRRLPEGACPDCERVVAVNKSGRRRYHRDPASGDHCLGSGVQVEERTFHIAELPPVIIGHEETKRSDRYAVSGRETCPDCARFIPLNTDGQLRRHRTEPDNPFVPYCTGGAS